MEINIFQVDAFSSKAFGGSPVAVVPNARHIKVEDMQRIANEMNVSETAFVHQLGEDMFEVRFFTSEGEVSLCGHATIATFYLMANKGYIKPIENGIKKATLVTNIRRYPIDMVYKNFEIEYIIMHQGKAKELKKIDKLDEILASLNLKNDDIGVNEENVEPLISSTVIPYLILPVRSNEILSSIKVDYHRLEIESKRLNISGVHVIYLPDKNSEIVYSRNFAPAIGIKEEPATGTANGAMVYYLKSLNLIEDNKIISLQGDSLKRPSKIYCFVEGKNGIFEVKIGGNANIVIEGIIKF